MKTQNKTTVADLEARTGKPNSIKNPSGRDSRSDQLLTNLKKRYARLFGTLEEPAVMPTNITVWFGAEPVVVDPKKLKQVAVFLKFIGVIE